MPKREDDRIVETATEARSGVVGHGLRYVLLIAIIAIVIAFLAIYLWYFT